MRFLVVPMNDLRRYTLPALSSATGVSVGILRRWLRAGWLVPVAFNGKSVLFSRDSFEAAERQSLTSGEVPVPLVMDVRPKHIDYSTIF